jgi:hypothetical protein
LIEAQPMNLKDLAIHCSHIICMTTEVFLKWLSMAEIRTEKL